MGTIYGSNGPNLTQLTHPLGEVLAQWANGGPGILVTDALDAVRDVETNKQVRQMLRDVQKGTSGWTVVASVREFELKFGRELREGFPGAGVVNFSSPDFQGVAHFHVPRFTEEQLDELVALRPEVGPFIKSARANNRSGALHRSPFYLRLAATLLKDGVSPQRLADWSSPALLLRRYWDDRVNEGAGADARRRALVAICQEMVAGRRMAVSEKQLGLAAPESTALRELQSRGILQGPSLQHGMAVNTDEIRFNHHLLHDYAIARALIPETSELFCDFVVQQPLLPVFYRQSFVFALEELWDADTAHERFWAAALRLEGEPKLHGITRLLAPILAARRVASPGDLTLLLREIAKAKAVHAPAAKALAHLSSGLQDADATLIQPGTDSWCAFAVQVSLLLPNAPFLETSLVHLLARLNAVGASEGPPSASALNEAGRHLLDFHAAKPVAQAWRYAASVAVEAIARTFTTAPAESERSLLSLLAPARLAEFPHEDLWELAENIRSLGPPGARVILSLFEAAFATEPEVGQYQTMGSAILPMRMQTSDHWNSIHYQLAGYYEKNDGNDAALMTAAACLAWNAVVRRRGARRNSPGPVVATVHFRGRDCSLIEDHGHIWNRDYEHEENRILTRYESLLRKWAAASDTARLQATLDCFAERNANSLLWGVMLEIGAEFPAAFGVMLVDLMDETSFLAHPDYRFAGTKLFGVLHRTGDSAMRTRMERLVVDLPKRVRLFRGERRKPISRRIIAIQGRLLGALEASAIVLPEVAAMWEARRVANALEENIRPTGPVVTSHTLTERELFARRGVDLKAPVNEEMFRLSNGSSLNVVA
ncbi:MAG: hypothetical protein PSW75_06895 [bacterium]|nr:hypothetical protein [bacterium]